MDKQNIEIDNSKISCVRIDFYTCRIESPPKNPSNVLEPYWPVNYVNRAWIPQTAGEQIWVMFEFASIEDRLTWEKTLPSYIRSWLDRDLIVRALKFGWHIRDYNGFYSDKENTQ